MEAKTVAEVAEAEVAAARGGSEGKTMRKGKKKGNAAGERMASVGER